MAAALLGLIVISCDLLEQRGVRAGQLLGAPTRGVAAG